MHILKLPYTVDQLILSDKALLLGIDNRPPENVVYNMKEYLIPGLTRAREILGFDIWHSSGYRCWRLNKAVGGSETSGHPEGKCEDFWCPTFGDPLAVVHKLASSDLKFDQLIYEHPENPWVHVSFDPRLRMQIKTAVFKDGKPTYHVGA
jgi:hypothetical protein